MILRILLFFSSVLLVSTNTGFPVNPTQIYPYQQNGYANPVVNQPNNISPYSQSTTAQNQSPPMNLSPSNVRQLLLNKILSSPSVQSILGPNLGGYGSNLLDFNNNPIAQNPVNNYFEAPPVFQNLNNQPIDLNKERTADIESEKPKKTKRKSRRKQEESEKNENKSSKNTKRKDKNIQTVENATENSKKSRKRSRKQNSDVSSQKETKNKETEGQTERKTKKRKNKENEKSKNYSTDKENKAEKSKSGRRRKKKPKSNNDNENVPLVEDTIQDMRPNEIKEGINVVNFNEGIVEENRVPRNPIPEVNDLLKALPLPENTGTNFMKTLSQFDNNPYMSNFFSNYENIYQSMLANGIGKDEKREKIKTARRKRKRKHDKRRTTQTKNLNSTEVTANTPKVNPKINVVTTERTIIIKETTQTNADSIPKLEGLKSIDKISEVKEEILKEDGYYENAQLDSNPNTSDGGHYNGYIDDYHPIFNDNAAYNANNKEVYVKHLGDTKYYYAIDKGNPDAINRRRFEHYQFPERIVKDYEINKQYEDVEKESLRNLKTEIKEEAEKEIKFRSPPHLELPDFQTRQINKSEINPEPFYNFEESNHVYRYVGDKSQIEDKSHNKHKSNGKLKEEPKNIETVFATSKVVKYGSPISSEEDNDEVEINKSIPPEETYFKDGGVTYVLAKSLDYPETYW